MKIGNTRIVRAREADGVLSAVARGIICRPSMRELVEHNLRHTWNSKANWATKGEPILAYIAESRWRVSCPDCDQSQLSDYADPVFYCHYCQNAGNDYHARPVAYPDERTRSAIEMLLCKRINPDNRNWLPQRGETLADIISENKKHGVI